MASFITDTNVNNGNNSSDDEDGDLPYRQTLPVWNDGTTNTKKK